MKEMRNKKEHRKYGNIRRGQKNIRKVKEK